jgi:hypothetical protein
MKLRVSDGRAFSDSWNGNFKYKVIPVKELFLTVHEREFKSATGFDRS